MKTKILRNVTLGITCLMLTLTITFSAVSSHVIHVAQGSPYGKVQSSHVIHIAQGSPYGRIQSNHIIHTDQGSPYGMI